MTTHLCAAIMVESLDSALAQAAQAAERGADLVEFRIDQFVDDVDRVAELVQRCALPCIVTCRPTWEGGLYDGDDQARISLLEHIGTAARPPAYYDVELATYQRSANLRQKVDLVVDHPGQQREVSTGLILSTHDFKTRPSDLIQKIEHMAGADTCRIIKVAWPARSLRDNLEVFEIIEAKHKPTIALCMGEEGLASRVLAKKFGAFLTFAAVGDGTGTAIGQPTLEQIKRLYRWDDINADTRVYGVIGYPVAQSMSPAIHNAGFDQTGFNGVYLPMPIPPEYEHFKATVGSYLDYKSLHFRGASVTIPHKQNLLRFVRESGGDIEPLAKTIGAANTLTVRDDGSLYASNTDYDGALGAVCDGMGVSREGLSDKRVAVIGAGGAARAIVAGFAHCGATVVVYNRTFGKAQQLADEFDGKTGQVVAARLEKLCDSCCHVFINCTPIGMHPNVDATPVPTAPTGKGAIGGKGWGEGTVVFDTIYNPIETRLLREARAAGCTTISGTDMFTRQAAGQFKLWTNRDAPIDVFERVLKERLEAMGE